MGAFFYTLVVLMQVTVLLAEYDLVTNEQAACLMKSNDCHSYHQQFANSNLNVGLQALIRLPCVPSAVIMYRHTDGSGIVPPPKCKPTESECLKSAAQSLWTVFADGMPELGTEPLDVMHLESIKLDLAGLKMNMTNVDIKGLKNSVIDKVKIDLSKKQLLIVFHTDIWMTGQYKAAGRLLILPINGDGDFTVDLKNYQLEMMIPFTIVKNKEKKDMLEMKEYKTKFDIRDNAHYELTNLFNGNKILSDTMLKFMNDNWKILSQEFGSTLLVKPNKKIFNAIKKYLQSKPLDEIIEA